MAEDVEKLQDEYKNVCKSMNKTKVISLQEKLKKTMPFWTTKILNQMKSDINLNKSMEGKERIKQDLLFLESMMWDRKVSYSSADKIYKKIVEKKAKRAAKEDKRNKDYKIKDQPCSFTATVSYDFDGTVS